MISAPASRYARWIPSTTSGRVFTRVSLQPSSTGPPKSAAVSCACCSMVPMAPSMTRMRLLRASTRASRRSSLAVIDERVYLMILTVMTRRTAFQLAGAAAALPSLSAQPAPLKGRLKQSAARWCYGKIGLDDLAREAARIGLKGIDLIDYKEWPTVQKYGLVPAITPGAGGIADGFNRKENHDKLVREMEENIPRAAAAKVPNVIRMDE